MDLSVWKHLGVAYAGSASSHERGSKNHRQGESVLLLLGNFASAQPSRAENRCQAWNTRNQPDSVDHNMGLNFVLHQNVLLFQSMLVPKSILHQQDSLACWSRLQVTGFQLLSKIGSLLHVQHLPEERDP